MPITLGKAEAHVASWSERLSRFPTRSTWSQHLFHTAQLEVAVEIIANRGIKCRSNVQELLCDVANQGALWNNPLAHDYVRLYFRPRNGFHLKTDGIKSSTDPYRVDPHMSVPIAFAFDLKKVITLENSGFIAGNFALSNQRVLTGDADFDSLDFNKIYHDSPPSAENRNEIHNARMSEVVVESFLSLDSLSCIVCRTINEQRMLEYALADRGLKCPRIVVEQRGAIFFRKSIFIDRVWLQEGQLHLKFQTPMSYPQPSYALEVRSLAPNGSNLHTKYLVTHGGPWRFGDHPAHPNTKWTVAIEGCIAYLGRVPSDAGLII